MMKLFDENGICLSDFELIKDVCVLLMGEAYDAGRHGLIHEDGPNNENFIKWRDERIEVMFGIIGLREKQDS